MKISIEEQGGGKVEVFTEIPATHERYILFDTHPVTIHGAHFTGLFQEFRLEGVSAWFNRFWMNAPAVLKAEGGMHVLELRLALRNVIHGEWDKIQQAALPVHHFQMGFVPHVLTRAVFDAPIEYQTFDIHFELSYLENLGLSYAVLDKFITKVQHSQPAELAPYPHHCTPRMIDHVQAILRNSYSETGRPELIKGSVKMILLEALEEISRSQSVELKGIKAKDVDKLYHVKFLIETDCPRWFGTEKLCKATLLNEYTLHVGFKQLFGTTPYDYFLDMRFMKAKDLLRQGETVVDVAHELDYVAAQPFIKKFREKFGYTPKEFQKRGL